MRFTIVLLLTVLAAASVSAQTKVTVDLSDPANMTTHVAAGTISARVINRIPGKEYTVTTEVGLPIEDPVSIAAAKKPVAAITPPAVDAGSGSAAPQVRLSTECDNLKKKIDDASTVQAIAAAIKDARSNPGQCVDPGLKSVLAGGCAKLLTEAKKLADATSGAALAEAIATFRELGKESGCETLADEVCDAILNKAKETIIKLGKDANATEKDMSVATAPLRATRDVCPKIAAFLDSIEPELDPVGIEKGEVLTITIVRADNNFKWERKFTTGKRGDWLTSYGVLIVPNRDANYSSLALGGNEYEIRRSRDREKFDLVPTLTFTFMRPKKSIPDSFLSPTFGLGYDLQSITASAGLAWTYNHNFAITAGVMLHQQRRLKGKFEEGQHYTETGTSPKDNNDLTETTYAPNIYVGITIRSLTNPFAQ